jgi:hypothetical protein
MASTQRSFNKIPTGTWDRAHVAWCELSEGALFRYLFLRTQDDITRAGTIKLRLRYWANFGKDITVDQVQAELDELWQAGFILPDWDTDELLIRGYIESDEVYKHANSLKSAKNIIENGLDSTEIKAALWDELHKLPTAELRMHPECRPIVNGLIEHLEPHGSPSRALPVPFGGGPGKAVVPPELSTSDSLALLERALHNGSEPDIGSPSGEAPEPPNYSVTTGTKDWFETGNEKQETEKQEERPSSPDGDDAQPGEDNPDDREDTRTLCQSLLDWMRRNGETRPGLKITKKWLRDARLMFDVDQRDPAKAMALLEWCQRDSFWRGRILSPEKFRKQYNQLRQDANKEWEQTRKVRPGGRTHAPTVTTAEEMRA